MLRLTWRGSIYFILKNYDNSIKDLDMAINLGSSNEVVFYNKAVALYSKNELNEAIDCLEEGINLFPDYYDFYQVKAKIYRSLSEQTKDEYQKGMFLKLANDCEVVYNSKKK